MTFEDYEILLKKAVASGFAKLDIPGKSLENDPVYALTVTDFNVPEDEKFNILIAGLHVGGERSALLAAMDTIEFLLKKSSQKYLKKFAVTLMPSVNPYGCFRTGIDQYHKNTSGFDPYVGQWGKSFNYPDLSLTDPEHEVELAAFLRTVDKIKPEILLDWHGANGRFGTDGEIMRETLGASLSNHFIMPWGTRLLAAMRKEVCKGGSAVFDLEEYMERIPAPQEYRAMYPNQVRPSNAVFYPDLYAYIKYHTMPIVMEIGQPETGWRALKGLMDYAMKMPPEFRGSLPVDHIGTDFGNLVVASYGANPGMRRRSRAELQSKVNSFLPCLAYATFVGEMGAALAIGDSGIKQLAGSIPLREMEKHHISEFPAADIPGKKNIRSYLQNSRLTMLLPLMANVNYSQQTLPDVDPIRQGVTLQMFIPIGCRNDLQMTAVLFNGEKLAESTLDGYELVRGSDGWHLFINLPPERTCKTSMYHILAQYKITKAVARSLKKF